jgi:polyhydroxyalkanoate synthesis regulator phasin
MNEEQLARVRDEIAAKGEGNHQEDRRVVGERGQRLVRPCH